MPFSIDRLKLYLQVYLLRALQNFVTLIDCYLISPRPLDPAFTITIPSRLSKHPGKIALYFFLPHGYTRANLNSGSKKELPLIVDFHGGGFVIGRPTDDARWATALLKDVNAVFVSVGYRMGPEYPQPTAVEDCIDAMRWLWTHAEEYGFDRSRTVITGFSAGGNLCFTTPMGHYRKRKVEDGMKTQDGKITGLVAFYPSVNQAIPRDQKIDSNPVSRTKGAEPTWLHRMIDDSYYQDLPAEGRASLNLSPALAPVGDLQDGLPERIAIFTCEWDKLLVEGENFRRELTDIGKNVGGGMIAAVSHGFDKKPGKHPHERAIMYGDAIEQIKTML